MGEVCGGGSGGEGVEVGEVPAEDEFVAVPVSGCAAGFHPCGGAAVFVEGVGDDGFDAGVEGVEPEDGEEEGADAAVFSVF